MVLNPGLIGGGGGGKRISKEKKKAEGQREYKDIFMQDIG